MAHPGFDGDEMNLHVPQSENAQQIVTTQRNALLGCMKLQRDQFFYERICFNY